MPNISVTFPEIAQSVSRPVIFDIISQVEDIVKIDKSTKIYFAGDTQRMQQPGTSIDATGVGSQNKDPEFTNLRRLQIEVTEDFAVETLSATPVHGLGNSLLFGDDSLGVYLAPMYATSAVSIAFKYVCNGKTEALRWRDDMRIRVSQMRDVNLHDISYHYILPTPFVELLAEVYTAREAKCGYGDSFVNYVKHHSCDRLGVIGDLAGKEARLSISETQMRIVGLFDFDGLPEKPELESESGTWSISFSYKFTYERPVTCYARYPIMVHNQLLRPELVGFTNGSYDLENVPKSYSGSLNGLSFFESDNQLTQRFNPRSEIILPEYDDFATKYPYRGLGNVLTALCEVDETDNRTLLNLTELGDIAIDADILDFILKSEFRYITQPYKSILNLTLYRNNDLAYRDSLTVTSALDVKGSRDLDLRNCHRVKLLLVTDLSMLDNAAIERLKQYPKAFVKIVSSIDELLRNHPGILSLGDKRTISDSDFNILYRFLTGIDLRTGTVMANLPVASGSSAVTISTIRNKYVNTGNNYRPLDVFRNIRGPELERYRRERIQMNKVLLSEIIAVN